MSAKRIRRVVRILSVLVGLGALAALAASFGLELIGDALARLDPGYLFLYLALGGTVRLGLGLRWHLVARSLSSPPPFSRFVAARLAGDAAAALVPTGSLGGDPLRIALLYGRGVGGASASAGVALDRGMETAGNIICGGVYVSVFVAARSLEPSGAPGTPGPLASALGTLAVPLLALLGLLAFLAMPLVMLRHGVRPVSPALPERWLRGRPRAYRWYELVRRTEDDLMGVVRERPGVFLLGVLGSLLIEMLIIGECSFLLAAFGLRVELPTVLLMLVAAGLVRVVPIPAGLGALEVGQVTLLAVVEGRAELGFLAGVVMRLHETLWLAVGLASLSLQGFSIARWRRDGGGEASAPASTSIRSGGRPA